jgi:predicted molibdopterin-dependent oxidoreductase YjgC
MEGPSLVPSICPYCGLGCGFYIVCENGTAVGLEYKKDHPTNEGALCPKGNAALDVVYHRDRLRYPLRRVNGHFEKVSWDEALEIIASNLNATKASHGPDALGFLSSAKCTNEENYLFQKLARMLGTNNIDHCARL